MDLEFWMKKNNVTQAELAKKVDVFPNQINNILRGRHKPTVKFATKIREFTKGEVTFDDLFTIKPAESVREKINRMLVKDEDVKEVIKEKIGEVIMEVLKEKDCQSQILGLVDQYVKNQISCESDCKKESV